MRSRLHSILLLGLLLALAGVTASWACQTTHTACVTPCLEADTSCCIASVDAGIAPPSLEPNLLQAASRQPTLQPATAACMLDMEQPVTAAIGGESLARNSRSQAVDLYLLDASFLI